MQKLIIPIVGFAAPSSNTDYVIATIVAPANAPLVVDEILLCPEGTLSTDGPFRYQSGVASGAGSSAPISITIAQLDPSKSLGSAVTPTAKQWGSGSPPTLATVQDISSVPASQPLYRVYSKNPITIKEGTIYCLVGNILGSSNTNIKFSGYVIVWA